MRTKILALTGPQFVAGVRKARSCEPKLRGLSQGERQPEEGGELVDASPQLQDLLPKFRLRVDFYDKSLALASFGVSDDYLTVSGVSRWTPAEEIDVLLRQLTVSKPLP